MSYSKDLGNVKGRTGAFVKPRVLNSEENPDNTKTIIKWELFDTEIYNESIPDTIIAPIYYFPKKSENDPYTIVWEARSGASNSMPEPMSLPQGAPGIPGVNIEPISNYSPAVDENDDIRRIVYHYNGASGDKKNEELVEGTIFLILDKVDPNDSSKNAPIAYVYDKESDILTGNVDLVTVQDANGQDISYNRNAFIKIENPINLTNYYTKDEVYNKTEIREKLEIIGYTQERIKAVLDNGLNEFSIIDLNASVEATSDEEETPEENNGD